MSSLAEPDLAYQSHHSSYIQGRSAPSTPGILGRSSSRRQLGGGLSRRLSLYDANALGYGAVEVNRHGVPLNAIRPDVASRLMPKAKSEAALLAQRRNPLKLSTPSQSQHHPASGRHHHRSHTASRLSAPRQDDWLTRTGLATTSILRESKGQSWLASQQSSASLSHDDDSPPSSPSDDDHEDYQSLARHSRMSHHHLHFADDELSPETPRHTSRWGSRFGSRAASARTSRRGSFDHGEGGRPQGQGDKNDDDDDDDYFSYGRWAEQQGADEDEAVGPDFVDLDPHDTASGLSTQEDAEEEVARLANQRSFGFGGLVDRLVGWSLFSVDEDRDGTDVEDENARDRARGVAGRSRAVGAGSGVGASASSAASAAAPATVSDIAGEEVVREPRREEVPEEDGWQDAAWLLSLASKVIF